MCQLINDLIFICPVAKSSPCLILWWQWLSFKNLKILTNNLENFKTVVIHNTNTKHFKNLNASHLSIATWELLSYSIIMTFDTLHRGAFCQFTFRWIYYSHSSKSTGKETGKTYLCALCIIRNVTLLIWVAFVL